MVVEAEVFPGVLPNLKDPDEYVKKNVATLVREVDIHCKDLQHSTLIRDVHINSIPFNITSWYYFALTFF